MHHFALRKKLYVIQSETILITPIQAPMEVTQYLRADSFIKTWSQSVSMLKITEFGFSNKDN